MIKFNQLALSASLVGALLAMPAIPSSAVTTDAPSIAEGTSGMSIQAEPQCGGDTKTDTKPKS